MEPVGRVEGAAIIILFLGIGFGLLMLLSGCSDRVHVPFQASYIKEV